MRLQQFLVNLIDEELARRRMTQTELARRCGHNVHYISRMLNGHAGSMRSFDEMLNALDIALPETMEIAEFAEPAVYPDCECECPRCRADTHCRTSPCWVVRPRNSMNS
jgi:transcriptional regulator with XRE-family HTH domain